MHVLVDSGGRVAAYDAIGLYRRFGGGFSVESALTYSVRNMGYVHVERGAGGWRVKFRPDMLSAEAFVSISDLLIRNEPYRISLMPDSSDDRPAEILSDVDDAIVRLDYLRSGETATQRSFTTNPLSFERLAVTTRRPALSAAYRVWRRTRGVFSADLVRRMLDAPLNAPLLLCSIDRDGTPVTRTFPSYINFWGDQDLAALIEKPMMMHPDQRYAASAAEGFSKCLVSQQPSFHLVDAHVKPPSGPDAHLRYDRLILPWRTSSGDKFVSSVSFARVTTPDALSSRKI